MVEELENIANNYKNIHQYNIKSNVDYNIIQSYQHRSTDYDSDVGCDMDIDFDVGCDSCDSDIDTCDSCDFDADPCDYD